MKKLLATAVMLAVLAVPAIAADNLSFQTLKFERDSFAGGSIHALLAIDSTTAYRMIRFIVWLLLKASQYTREMMALSKSLLGARLSV